MLSTKYLPPKGSLSLCGFVAATFGALYFCGFLGPGRAGCACTFVCLIAGIAGMGVDGLRYVLTATRSPDLTWVSRIDPLISGVALLMVASGTGVYLVFLLLLPNC